MNFNFGDNFKYLRKEKGFTQEDVAEYLNVSKQSVSRWENNVTYPDITLLPIIASFFNISVDSLLGADYEKNASLKAEYSSRRLKAHQNGDIRSAFEISSELYNRFPTDEKVLNLIINDSYLMGFHNIDNKRDYYLKMAISISSRFLKLTDDIENRCRAIHIIADCYKILNNLDEAKKWLNKLPTVWNCVENVTLSVYDRLNDKAIAIKTGFDGVIHLLYRMMYSLASEQKSTEDKICILEKIPQFFKLIFENEDYGSYNNFLSATYFEIAKAYNEKDKSTSLLKKALKHSKAYDNTVKSKHTSLLYMDLPINSVEWTSADNLSCEERLFKNIEKAKFDFEVKL